MKLVCLSLQAQRQPVIASAARQSSPVIDYENEKRSDAFRLSWRVITRDNCGEILKRNAIHEARNCFLLLLYQ